MWKLRKRTSASLPLRKPCTTCGGTWTSSPAPEDDLLVDEHHGQLALEHVEDVGVLVVDVEVGTGAARPVAAERRVHVVVLADQLDGAVRRVSERLDHVRGA